GTWDTYESIRVVDPKKSNQEAREVLNQGASALRFEWEEPQLDKLAVLLEGIELPYIQSAFVVPFDSYPEFCLRLAEYIRKKAYPPHLTEGYIQADFSRLKSGKE